MIRGADCHERVGRQKVNEVTMKTFGIALTALTIVASAPAWAKEPVTITGLGGVSCSQFASDYRDDTSAELNYFSWAQGFMSADNLVSAWVTKQSQPSLLPQEFPAATQMAFIRDWCAGHQDNMYAKGVIALEQKLKGLNHYVKEDQYGGGAGIGLNSCREFGQEVRSSPALYSPYLAWTHGFASGFNMLLRLNNKAAIDLEPVSFPLVSQGRYLKSWCDAHPLDQFVSGVIDLLDEVKKH
jgi:hypothetical protein